MESMGVFALFDHLESDSASHLVNLSENQSYLFLKSCLSLWIELLLLTYHLLRSKSTFLRKIN